MGGLVTLPKLLLRRLCCQPLFDGVLPVTLRLEDFWFWAGLGLGLRGFRFGLLRHKAILAQKEGPWVVFDMMGAVGV